MGGIILLKSWPMCHNFPASFFFVPSKRFFAIGWWRFLAWFHFNLLILELRLVIIAWHCNNWWLNTTVWEEILTENGSVAAQTDGSTQKTFSFGFQAVDKMSQHSQLSSTALAWINLQPPCALRSLPSSLAVFCLQRYVALLKDMIKIEKNKKRK